MFDVVEKCEYLLLREFSEDDLFVSRLRFNVCWFAAGITCCATARSMVHIDRCAVSCVVAVENRQVTIIHQVSGSSWILNYDNSQVGRTNWLISLHSRDFEFHGNSDPEIIVLFFQRTVGDEKKKIFGFRIQIANVSTYMLMLILFN